MSSLDEISVIFLLMMNGVSKIDALSLSIMKKADLTQRNEFLKKMEVPTFVIRLYLKDIGDNWRLVFTN